MFSFTNEGNDISSDEDVTETCEVITVIVMTPPPKCSKKNIINNKR